MRHGSDCPAAMLDCAVGSWMELQKLAGAAKVPWDSVARFERGSSVRATTIQAIQDTLENAGVVFIAANDGGPGARLRR
jgi:hypothetical protein